MYRRNFILSLFACLLLSHVLMVTCATIDKVDKVDKIHNYENNIKKPDIERRGRYVSNGNIVQDISRYTKLDEQFFQFASQGSFILFVGFLLQTLEPILTIILVVTADIIITIAFTDYIYSAIDLKYNIPLVIYIYIAALAIVVVTTILAASLIVSRRHK